ncbi:MAG: hypothetical protein HYX68_23910 [Planctomycetes bacterium]|nr:hypothetical protein [Planctomycetota bacterium]
MTNVKTYQSYRGLPSLAGLASIEDAARPGLSVEACVARLKGYHYAFLRMHEIFTARITAEPIYELKTGFAHHAYLCAEHVAALRQRIGEMREPPLGLEEIPHEALQIFFDEIRAAPTTEALLLGIYEKALPALNAAIERHLRDTNPIADAPSVRVLRFAHLEIDDMLDFGRKGIECLVDDATYATYRAWLTGLDELLAMSGALAGAARALNGEPTRRFSASPHVYDRAPKRDERFQDVWNQGVNAEAFLYTPEMPAKAKTVMMLYKRLREIDVPEMMASIIVETKGKPWDYYRDMSRQLWDEARHAMMGEVGFVALGVDWTRACITVNWSHRLNTECTPIERHAVLYFIEQGLMTKTGKRYEWEVGVESGIPLMATIQDYDWADEVLHAQLGRLWYIPEMGDWKKALDYGDQCWSRILSNWQAVKDQGLTRHANWWPDIYRQACEAWGEPPDANALAFAETYEAARADLKGVGGSA